MSLVFFSLSEMGNEMNCLISRLQIKVTMGKGDIKSKKGKMANGSFGNKRKRNETMPKAIIVPKAAKEAVVVVAEAKPKAKAKTAAAKKE